MRKKLDDAIWFVIWWPMAHVGLVCGSIIVLTVAAMTPWFHPYLGPIFDAIAVGFAWVVVVGGFAAFFVFMILFLFAQFGALDMPPYGLDDWLKGNRN